MNSATNPVQLTQTLVRYNTVNPPGQELACAQYIGGLLEGAGFRVSYHEHIEGRPSLIGRIGGTPDRPPLCMTGHTDTVPLGLKPWSFDPFCGEIADGMVLGRGTSDMKAGVAAIVSAAISLADRLHGTPGLELIITADEECGCNGANALASGLALGRAGAILIAEPTSNQPLVGHKGVMRLEVQADGITAHSSMPEKGRNAIYAAARAITKLENFDFGVAAHPVLGGPTLSVGWIQGGINVNSVPDLACFGADIRLVPAVEPEALKARLRALLGPEVSINFREHGNAIWTEPDEPWAREVFDVVEQVTGARPEIAAAPYFTDGSALSAGYGAPPAIILGPGEAEQAHQTDEFCYTARIEAATEIYRELVIRWCGV